MNNINVVYWSLWIKPFKKSMMKIGLKTKQEIFTIDQKTYQGMANFHRYVDIP